MVNEIMVSVCMITYNHAAYISQAIEGVLSQECNFSIELIIGEDDSNDNTAQIIQGYAIKYPKEIRVRYNKMNLGMMPNFIKTLEECTGKYITLCEGDDYWTDPYKLQKQVDFLEKNPEYAMVAADVELIDNEGNTMPPNQMLLEQRTRAIKEPGFMDLLQGNLINTLTVCVRADLMKQLALRVKRENLWYVVDYWFWLNIAINHKIFIMDDAMAAYRISPDGVSRKPNFLKNRMGWIKYNAIISYTRDKKDLKKKDKHFLHKAIYGVFVNSKLTSKLWFNSLLWLMRRPYCTAMLIFSKIKGKRIA